MNLLAIIWFNRNKVGEGGIRKYNENAVQNKYIDNLNKLFNTMNYIYAQEKAGHNNFISVKKIIKVYLL